METKSWRDIKNDVFIIDDLRIYEDNFIMRGNNLASKTAEFECLKVGPFVILFSFLSIFLIYVLNKTPSTFS